MSEKMLELQVDAIVHFAQWRYDHADHLRVLEREMSAEAYGAMLKLLEAAFIHGGAFGADRLATHEEKIAKRIEDAS